MLPTRYRYFVAAPSLPGGWTLLGEVGKIVPISAQRVSGFALVPAANGYDGFSLTVSTAASGTAETSISYYVSQGTAAATVVTCDMTGKTHAQLTCSSSRGGCSCA